MRFAPVPRLGSAAALRARAARYNNASHRFCTHAAAACTCVTTAAGYHAQHAATRVSYRPRCTCRYALATRTRTPPAAFRRRCTCSPAAHRRPLPAAQLCLPPAARLPATCLFAAGLFPASPPAHCLYCYVPSCALPVNTCPLCWPHFLHCCLPPVMPSLPSCATRCAALPRLPRSHRTLRTQRALLPPRLHACRHLYAAACVLPYLL